MAARHWYMEFDYARWLSDARLSKCRAATRGIWMDWLCVMCDLDRCGQLTGDLSYFARVGRCRIDEAKSALHDLRETLAADVVYVSDVEITLTNRRMQREFASRKSNRDRQLRYRQKTSNGDVTRESAIKDEVEDGVEVEGRKAQRNALWDALCSAYGLKPASKNECSRIGALVTQLEAYGATPADIPIRIKRYRAKYPTMSNTENALVKHWPHLATGPKSVASDTAKAAWEKTQQELARQQQLDAEVERERAAKLKSKEARTP